MHAPVFKGKKGRSVAVIGAGAAGLAAARQLQYYGYNVVVFEHRVSQATLA